MSILVAYAWLAVAAPARKCVLREYMDRMPGRCILWSNKPN